MLAAATLAIGAGGYAAAFTFTVEIVSGPSGTVSVDTAVFSYRANDGADFTCSLDDQSGPCGTSATEAATTYTTLTAGTHTFLVEATERPPIVERLLGTSATSTTATTSRSWVVALPQPPAPPPPPPPQPPPPPPPPRGPPATHPQSAGGRGWLGWLGPGALGVLGAGAVVVGVRWGPLHYRRRVWQRRSRTDEPDGECTVCTWYCRRTDIELKPARRRIEALAFTAGEQVVARVEGKPVKALNRAVRRYRKQRPTSELRLTLQPIAERILHLVGNASAGLEPGPVTLHAHLKGGELECAFELYHCVAGAQGPTWSKETEWKATIADEREERVAGLTVPLVPTVSFAYLLEDLLTFVTKVDVPPPQAAQALT